MVSFTYFFISNLRLSKFVDKVTYFSAGQIGKEGNV